ncbi:MAG: molybdate ABC transporter permease subunit [Microbacteriaceae bacterium]|nr:MAG: molybdate ABC transporter permease subunit [Microbacteriaceae bacterium]
MTGRVPRFLYVPAVLGLALLILPIVGLLFRLDWATVPQAITSQAARDALSLSLRTATVATTICFVIGVPLALVIARSRTRLAGVLRALTTLPLVLPPLVGGIALLYLLGRTGLIGASLEGFGIRVPFTTAAVVIAQSFVALPFLVISVEGALRTAGTRYEAVAATLGAGRWITFWRVTLPLATPGLVAGTVLCFARALGEFGATALFAGNAEGVTRTMPLAIYTAFNGAGVSQDSAIALSLLLVAVAIVILLVMRSWRADVPR